MRTNRRQTMFRYGVFSFVLLLLLVACGESHEQMLRQLTELDRMHGLDTYDYGARQHYPVLCRWDRMDPLSEKYYGVSPYAYCTGNPVNAVDPNGQYIYYVDNNGDEYKYKYRVWCYNFYDNDNHVFRNNDVNRIIHAIDEIRKSKNGSELLTFFDNSDQYHVYISINHDEMNQAQEKDGKAMVDWDPNYQEIGILERGVKKSPSFLSLAHELFHAKNYNTNSIDNDIWLDSQPKVLWEEYKATIFENKVRSDLDLLKRTYYASTQEGAGYGPSAIPFEKSGIFTLLNHIYALWKDSIHY